VRVDRGSVRWVTLYDDEHGFEPNYLQSLLPMIGHDLGGEGRLARGGWALKLAKGYDLAVARNEATADFLESNVEWVLFIDSDMGWEIDALDKLMASADPKTRPIVGGLCFGYSPTEDGYGEANGPFRFPFPTIYDLAEDGDERAFRIRWGYRAGSLEKCGATGAAFLLIHRSALETMAEKHGPTWWTRMKPTGAKSLWGEDTSFCVRAGMCDIPIYVDTRVRTSHLKPVYVSEVTYTSMIRPPLADEEIDVIVPVLGRPHHAEPFMKSLRATTGLAFATVVANVDDLETIDAWRKAGAEVLTVDPELGSFACKANYGYEYTNCPWMLFVGSDVAFKPGWWDHALAVARTNRVDVVATNDLLNNDVRDGRLATHPVMRRGYVDELGASWDGPGIVAHEGYSHWYVDAEWSTVANQRGTMAPALASQIEHLHPIIGKAEMDETYRIGQKHRANDQALFEARRKRFARAA
jgi:hypothetical protein